jgi:type I restriction enzyme, S subunit
MRKYLRAANVGWDGLILDDVKLMNFTDAEMALFRLEPGDLLLNEASGSPREVGKPAIWRGEIENCAFQNTLLRVRPHHMADSQYLSHFFRYEAANGAFARGSRGVGIHHLGRDALARWPVPLPPLDEQRRIAAILDQADALRTKRRENLNLLATMARSIYWSMFGGRKWPQVKLMQLCSSADEIRSVHPR